MKTINLVWLLLLFAILAEAQSYQSNLLKTVDTINAILQQDKNVQFTNQDYGLFYPTKINANLQGEVFCIESSTKFGPESNGLIFNLQKVKYFVINENQIKAIGQDLEATVVIYMGSSKEALAFKKELDALMFICSMYSKQDPQFKCD